MEFGFKIEPFQDEALESYLLRLSQANGFECYADFADEILYQIKETHSGTAGSFPMELSRANIYHSQSLSDLRVRGLIRAEQLLGNSSYSLLKVALSHS